jgi:polar amino acid transport system substrate-binding protein
MNSKLCVMLPVVLSCLAMNGANAGDSCATGKTISEGMLTVGTGNPAYFPWVIDDAPESGQGFEAAVAYALAERMGFAKDQVTWVRTSFDQAIQPGEKSFDINMQQYSITAEREQTIDFSAPYYTSSAAIVVRQPTLDAGATTTKQSLSGLRWGAAAGTTALELIDKLIGPAQGVLLYDDTADVTEAMKADQIDATLVDLPTALFLSAVMLDDGVVMGQYPHDASGALDQFGAVMTEGNPLKECVDAAIGDMTADGSLAAIETEWLSDATSVPVIVE